MGPAEVRRRRPHQGRHGGDPPLGVAGHVLPPQRHEGLHAAGHTIKAGDKISLWYISANRDEDVWDDPFTFDITRDPNPHIAFGGGGPHFCLGAQLARMEIQVLFEELVRRVDRVEGLGAPDRLRSNFIGGIKHLPVRFQTELTSLAWGRWQSPTSAAPHR